MAVEGMDWAPLLPVIVGGSLALLGGAVTQIVAHRLQRHHQRRQLRIQKFEELFEHLAHHDAWLERQRNHLVFGQVAEVGSPPIERALAIVALHFPGFSEAVRQLDYESSRYQMWMAKSGARRVRGAVSEVNDGFADAYQSYREARSVVARSLTDYAASKGENV